MKKKDEKFLKEFYKEFDDLYNPDIIKIGTIFKSRILQKHYGLVAMKQILCVMKWFLESYHDDCILEISYFRQSLPRGIVMKNGSVIADKFFKNYKPCDFE